MLSCTRFNIQSDMRLAAPLRACRIKVSQAAGRRAGLKGHAMHAHMRACMLRVHVCLLFETHMYLSVNVQASVCPPHI
jgi:hypothetical protein